jgi:hypothetical protein
MRRHACPSGWCDCGRAAAGRTGWNRLGLPGRRGVQRLQTDDRVRLQSGPPLESFARRTLASRMSIATHARSRGTRRNVCGHRLSRPGRTAGPSCRAARLGSSRSDTDDRRAPAGFGSWPLCRAVDDQRQLRRSAAQRRGKRHAGQARHAQGQACGSDDPRVVARPRDRGPRPRTPVPTGVGGNWHLIFDDEFNGTSLNAADWSTGWFGSGITAGIGGGLGAGVL